MGPIPWKIGKIPMGSVFGLWSGNYGSGRMTLQIKTIAATTIDTLKKDGAMIDFFGTGPKISNLQKKLTT